MAGLKSLVPPKLKVAVGDGEFDVRGLSLSEITQIGYEYQDEIEQIFSGKKEWVEIIRECPDLVANIIAHASDEPDSKEQAKKLPFGVQLTALEVIWEATAVDVQTLGKMLAGLVESVEDVANLVTLSPALANGLENQKKQQSG